MEAFVTFIYCLTDFTTPSSARCVYARCFCVCVSVWSRVNAEWLQVFELQWGVSGSTAPLFLWEPSSRTVFVVFVSQKWLLVCLIAWAPSAEQDGFVIKPVGVDIEVQTETLVIWNPSTLRLPHFGMCVCVRVKWGAPLRQTKQAQKNMHTVIVLVHTIHTFSSKMRLLCKQALRYDTMHCWSWSNS